MQKLFSCLTIVLGLTHTMLPLAPAYAEIRVDVTEPTDPCGVECWDSVSKDDTTRTSPTDFLGVDGKSKSSTSGGSEDSEGDSPVYSPPKGSQVIEVEGCFQQYVVCVKENIDWDIPRDLDCALRLTGCVRREIFSDP